MDREVRIADAERAFREWRRGRGPGRGKAIPDELWDMATRVAGVYGRTATAQRLRLNYAKLKERGDLESRGKGVVELAASELAVVAESVVELEDAAGFRVRLVLRGVSLAAVTAAAKELWGAAH